MTTVFSDIRLQGKHVAARKQPVDSFIIFMHGYGADQNDLLSLAKEFSPYVPHADMISVQAPFACDMSEHGRQWFDLIDRSEASMRKGVHIAADYVHELIDAAMAHYNLPAERIILVGFSQGAMTALHVGLRRKHALGAVIAYSGKVIAPDHLASELTSKTPLCIIHGKADQVVPFTAFEEARTLFKTLKLPHKAYANDRLGHGIDPGGIKLAIQFIEGVFAAKSS